MLQIKQRRSSNGATRSQRETLRSLGLRGIGKSVERPDSPPLRGMVETVGHLVEVSETAEKRSDKRPGGDG
jgi:large subunit ribosomal protein L30